MIHKVRNWFSNEYATGVLLMVATALALFAANTDLRAFYDSLLETHLAVTVGGAGIDKPLLLWINDGLMAIFFLFVALEVKREMLEGELSSLKRVALPGIAAIGGMAVPAAVYLAVTWGDPIAMNGWAIPAATDIAFALGILALIGSRAPVSLKVFLLTLAVIDDLGAIAIIALFYTADVSAFALLGALAMLAIMAFMNYRNVQNLASYLIFGLIAWVFVLKSGVHATLAGVAIGFLIPLRGQKEGEPSMAIELEHQLKPWVSFAILPIFAFANAGLNFSGLSVADVLSPVPLAIGLGLVVGKQIGVLGFAWLAVKSGLAQLPTGARWSHVYGIAWLTGIGFTMSLFIASLAFPPAGTAGVADYRLGILLGSTISAIGGYLILRLACAASEAKAHNARMAVANH